MIRTSALCLVVAGFPTVAPVSAQQHYTIEQVLAAPFATELVASPSGGKFAWVESILGVRNIWIAEPPDYTGRQLTHYTADDGKFLGKLAFTPDARSLLYVRGGAHTGRIIPDAPNPSFDPAGGKEDIWIISAATGEVREPSRIDDGIWPEVSPRGNLVAYLKGEEIWAASLTNTASGVVAGAPRRLIRDRGRAAPQGNVTSLRWSPAANRLAFISLRDQHSFIGVYDADANTLVFLDPSTDRDQWPEWSPDGTRIAFVREASQPVPREAPTVAPSQLSVSGTRSVRLPWSLRVADVRTGKGHEVWRAAEGMGSAFWLGFMNNEHQLFWGAGDRIAFPWERTGWMHMYSVLASGGGPAIELTPGGEFEVEHVALAPNGRDLIFMSNQGDMDRRHLWLVSIAGGTPRPVTTGKGVEYWPVFTSDGAAFAFQATTPRTPPRVELLRMREIANGPASPSARQVLAPGITPRQFPSAALVEPQQVVFSSLDGMQVHGQLYLPADYKKGERYPALVFLHGGPNMQQLLGYHYHRLDYYQRMYGMNQYLANHGYIVMSVNYRRGIGYGLKFREPESPAGGDPRHDPDVIDIIGAGQYLKARPDVDPKRLGIWGGSAGGTRTILGLAFGADLFVAGVDFHGVATQALGKTQGWKAPVLIVHGDDDRNVPINLSVSLSAELRRRGIEVEELILPNEGHSFFQHSTWLRVFQATDDFLTRKVKKAGSN